MPDYEWIIPRKMLDYYVNQADGIEEAQKQLYLAVITGEVRAKLNDRILGPEWLKQVSLLKQEHPFTLPPDLLLSVEDAKRKWGDK
jgi:hypothetical protein